jgi:dephospho-CoA kinase
MDSFVMFGLTGGIASGKSTVAKRWKSRGLPIFDADVAARSVVEKGKPGLDEIVRQFGLWVLDDNGCLDRKKLAQVVFSDPKKMVDLENIIWPKILEEAESFKEQVKKDNHPIACYEAAILIERGHADLYRPLVVVWAPEPVRISRMVKRDGFTEEQARLRLSAQTSDSERNAAADYLISTDKPKADTLMIIDGVLDHICRKASIDPERYGVTSVY